LKSAIRPHTKIISIEAANGEIGTLQDIAALSAIARERGILFHSDITQGGGEGAARSAYNVDLASFSGATRSTVPKGIGGLFRTARNQGPSADRPAAARRKTSAPERSMCRVVIGMAAAFQLRAAEMAEEGARTDGNPERIMGPDHVGDRGSFREWPGGGI